MSIAVICPHCESRYTLQPDLLGKPMRCPNSDCREVFTVQDANAAPAATIQPRVGSGRVEDLVPVLDPEPAPTLESVSLPSAPELLVPEDDEQPAPPPVRPRRPADRYPKAEPALKAESLAADGPKEVAYSDTQAVSAATIPVDPDELAEDDIFQKRRRRRRLWIFPAVLAGLAGALVLALGGIFAKSVQNEWAKEGILFDKAEEERKKPNYVEATKLYTELVTKYPESEKIERYQFLLDLTAMHVAVDANGKEKPTEAVAAFNEFIKKYEESPLIRADEDGFGYDVFDAGRKLTTAIGEHARERLAKYVRNRGKNQDDLGGAEQAVQLGKPLLPIIDRYRLKDVTPLDEQAKTFDEVLAKCVRERERLVVLAPFRGLPNDPSDERIADFVIALKQSGFEKDAEAVGILNESKLSLRKLIRTVLTERAPAAVPKDAAPALLFIAPPIGEKPPPPTPTGADYVPETFFAAARGILYAIDAEFGTLLWATRVGSQGRGSNGDDVPVRVTLGTGGTELAIVTSEINGKAGLTARIARTGEAVWYQPLEAPPAGRPVAVGGRLYVPLQDAIGTFVEIEFTSGNRLSQMSFRQRLGPGAVVQPGTPLVYVPGEGRRVFVIDVHPIDPAGDRLPMKCLALLTTDHPDRSLRVPPVISGPAGETTAPRFLVLTQSDGTLSTRVRAFALKPLPKGKADDPPPELPAIEDGAASVPGHISFPPAADGERIAVVTDAGTFALFGTNQQGNQDKGLFPVPVSGAGPEAKKPISGQVVFADEDEFWILSRGNLVRMRLGLTLDVGLRVADTKPIRPIGVPLHRPQWTIRRDTALAVVRSDETDGVRAVAFDPRDGRIRWQRKLGAVPPAGPFPQADGGAIVVDEDGAVYGLPAEAAGVSAVGTRPVQPTWVLARPSGATAFPPRAVADAKGVWVLIPERIETGRVLRVRYVTGGKVEIDQTVPLPDRPAGEPVVVGGSVAVPLADGFVYRFDAAAGKLALGPQWRGEGAGLDAVCYLALAGADEFVGTDGGKRVTRWKWAAAGDWRAVVGPWEMRDKIAMPPVVVAVGDTARRMAVADVSGNVYLLDADRTTDVKPTWRGSASGAIPPGRPFGGFAVPVVGGKPRLVYGTGGTNLVCLTLGDEAPAWVMKGKDGADDLLGWTLVGDTLIVTDVAGTVTGVQASDGAVVGSVRPAVPDLFPRVPAVPFGPDKVLLIEWDGSAVFLARPGK